MNVDFLSCQFDSGDVSNHTLEVEHECRVQGHIYHVSLKSLADLIDLSLQLSGTS